MKKTKNLLRVSEIAIMIAVATVLSIIPLFTLPQGGTVTVCSMMPLAIVAYRYGLKWGTLSAFVYSTIQLLLGLNNVAYCKTAFAVIIVILFDYLVAFSVFGLVGIFRDKIKNQLVGISIGMVIASILRYICHVISGYVVWGEWASGEWLDKICASLGVTSSSMMVLIYSLGYNSFVFVDIAISIVAVCVLGSIVDFRQQGFKLNKKNK